MRTDSDGGGVWEKGRIKRGECAVFSEGKLDARLIDIEPPFNLRFGGKEIKEERLPISRENDQISARRRRARLKRIIYCEITKGIKYIFPEFHRNSPAMQFIRRLLYGLLDARYTHPDADRLMAGYRKIHPRILE